MTDLITKKYEELSVLELKDRANYFFDFLDVGMHTKREYKYRIGLFLDFISAEGFDRNSFLDFKKWLAEREDFSVATKNKYLATARIFLKELYRLGAIPIEITVNVRSFNQSSKHKREGLNHAEIERLATKIHNLPNTERNTRLKALFCLLVFQGLRQVEVVRLDVGDLDLVAKKAFVQGKGMDDKEAIHLLPETVKSLKAYMHVNKVSSGVLFKSLGNRKGARISTMTIKRELKSVFQESAVEKTVHGLRHYYITTLLEKFDVRDVRKFSRHKSLEMLIVYDDEIEISHKASEVAECFRGLNVA